VQALQQALANEKKDAPCALSFHAQRKINCYAGPTLDPVAPAGGLRP
jgi:hypothetical protein